MPSNCGAGEDSSESLGQQGDKTNLKGNQHWILAGGTDVKAETPVFWLSDGNSWLIGKVPDAGKDWGQKKKTVSEDEMAGWMASLMQWTWAWANFGRCWGTGRPGVAKYWIWLGDWTTTVKIKLVPFSWIAGLFLLFSYYIQCCQE